MYTYVPLDMVHVSVKYVEFIHIISIIIWPHMNINAQNIPVKADLPLSPQNTTNSNPLFIYLFFVNKSSKLQ